MANSNGWGDGAANNSIGWGQGANNAIGWGDSHAKSWAGDTDIVGIDSASSEFFTATGITGATQQTAIDNLVKGLKSDGLWSKMKAVYPFATDNRNLLGYTEDFGNAYWNKTGSSAIISNTTTSPNGTLTADTFITASGSLTNRMISSTLDIIGQTVCVSIYAKSDTFNRIRLSNNASNVITADFNLDTGTLIGTTGSVISTSVLAVGDGWYRCSMSYVATDATVLYRMPLITSGISASIFVWGAQLELGSTATTYQPIATTQQAFISNQFKYNLVNPVDSDAAFRLVFNGGWTHSANGATPNGTNGYANTYLVPSSVLSLNSTHISCYTRTNTTVSAPLLSSEDATTYNNGLFIWPKYSGNLYSVRINDNSSDSATAVANTQGLHLATRTASNVKKYRHNTTQIFANTTASTSLNTSSIYVGASRNNANYSTHQTAFASIGDGLTDTEAANLYTAVQAFQTKLSRQV